MHLFDMDGKLSLQGTFCAFILAMNGTTYPTRCFLPVAQHNKSIITGCQVTSHNFGCNSDAALAVPPDDYNGFFVLYRELHQNQLGTSTAHIWI
jgi:hypothetical protein